MAIGPTGAAAQRQRRRQDDGGRATVSQTWRDRWRAVPSPIRKSVVLTIGATLLALGGISSSCGPFTPAFVIAGIAILSSEFVGRTIMEKRAAGRHPRQDWVGRIPFRG